MDLSSSERLFVQVMNNGFLRAASSFSKLVNKNVRIVNTQSMLVRNDDDLTLVTREEDGSDLNILVTQIIGEISGKSFLIFTHDETQEILKAMNTLTMNEKLKEAFLLEIDNIISASVIAQLANQLNLKVYGGVPHLVKVPSAGLTEFMRGEVSDDELSRLIFCNTTFQFDGGESIHPQFVWKVSTNIFSKVPTVKLTTQGL